MSHNQVVNLQLSLPNNMYFFLHLRPELGSERRIDDRLEVENVQVGDVAIVPACASHWNGIEQDIAEAIIITLEPQFLGQVSTELDKCDRLHSRSFEREFITCWHSTRSRRKSILFLSIIQTIYRSITLSIFDSATSRTGKTVII
jgi:hypothetical protein